MPKETKVCIVMHKMQYGKECATVFEMKEIACKTAPVVYNSTSGVAQRR